MTDTELLTIVAELMGVNSSIIKQKFDIHRHSAISRIYAKTKPFWIKTSGQIALTATSDKVIDLKAWFPDIWQLRFLYTEDGRLDYKPEEIFRQNYSTNPADVGGLSVYTTLGNYEIELYPPPNETKILYANYFYKPSFDTISSIPDEWHYAIQDYILAMMLPKQYTLELFLDGLKDIKEMARPSIEQDFEFEQSAMQAVINSAQVSLSRSS